MLLTSACYFILASYTFVQGKCFMVCCTVETAKRYKTQILTCIVLFSILESIGLVLSLIYSFKADGGSLLVMTLLVHVIWAGATICLAYLNYKTACSVHTAVLNFHDFLINYRQTPRSKILRRHLPSMDAVVEEESRYE